MNFIPFCAVIRCMFSVFRCNLSVFLLSRPRFLPASWRRALALQARGCRFDPGRLHLMPQGLTLYGVWFISAFIPFFIPVGLASPLRRQHQSPSRQIHDLNPQLSPPRNTKRCPSYDTRISCPPPQRAAHLPCAHGMRLRIPYLTPLSRFSRQLLRRVRRTVLFAST